MGISSGPRLEDSLDRAPPLGFEDIQHLELGRLFGVLTTFRLAVLPFVALLAAAVAVYDPTPWRIGMLSAVVLGLGAVAVIEVVRLRRSGFTRTAIPLNLALMSAFQLTVVFATGALESPLLPAMLPLTVISSMAIGARPALGFLVGPQLAAVWLFAIGQVNGWFPEVNLPIFGGGVRGGHNDAHLWTSALVLTGAIGIATAGGVSLRRGFDAMLHRALTAREDELAARAEHARELTALSGEIAHELKNPLATIKGLAALLATDATGKSAERLAVLRGEVDRMQGTLEEFLNFSRPLVPLAQVPTDLSRLCAEVAALHEGIAGNRGVRVTLDEGDPVVVRCDPRKVRQVLINLLQNALEASPRGGEVTLAVAMDGPSARVEILDRGPGLDPAIAAEAFSPGVTSRASGSGLGLTIARALARQHNGDVTLEPRAGGGCRALLTLPREVAS